MPRTPVSKMFFLTRCPLKRYPKGTRFLGINASPEETAGEITLVDLLAFLQEKGIDQSKVRISLGFSTTVKP